MSDPVVFIFFPTLRFSEWAQHEWALIRLLLLLSWSLDPRCRAQLTLFFYGYQFMYWDYVFLFIRMDILYLTLIMVL